MSEVKTGNDERCGAIEGVLGAIAPSFGWGKGISDVREGVYGNHAFAHIVCPLQDLGPNVDQEGLGLPSTQNHDSVARYVLEEECHSSAGSDGLVTDLVRVKPKGGFSAENFAGVTQAFADVVARDGDCSLSGGRIDGVDRRSGSRVGDSAENPLDDGYKTEYGAEALVV